MKVIIVALSVFFAVATAKQPQNDNMAEKIFDTLTNALETENFHQLLTYFGDEKSDRLCPLCQKLVTALDSFLGDVKVQSKLSAALAKVCDKITDTNKQQSCTNFITKDFPMVLEILKSLLTPTTVCSKLFKFCPNPSTTDLATSGNPFVPKVVDDLKCAACFSGFGFIEQAFLNQDFSNFCIEEIQPACDSISDPEKLQKCYDTVTKVVGDIFSGLNNYLNPQKLCMGGKIPNTGCPQSFLAKFKV